MNQQIKNQNSDWCPRIEELLDSVESNNIMSELIDEIRDYELNELMKSINEKI